MNRNLFHGLVILVVALVGLPLFRRSLRSQVILLLLTIAVVLLIGVFVPEFARTLLAGVFPVAVGIMIILWLIGHASRLRWSRAVATSTVAASPSCPDASQSTMPAVAAAETMVAEQDDEQPPPANESATGVDKTTDHPEGERDNG